MARIVVMGAGIAGMPAAYDLKKLLGTEHAVYPLAPRRRCHVGQAGQMGILRLKDGAHEEEPT